MTGGDTIRDGALVADGMPDGFVMVPLPPRLAEYQRLRQDAGRVS